MPAATTLEGTYVDASLSEVKNLFVLERVKIRPIKKYSNLQVQGIPRKDEGVAGKKLQVHLPVADA